MEQQQQVTPEQLIAQIQQLQQQLTESQQHVEATRQQAALIQQERDQMQTERNEAMRVAAAASKAPEGATIQVTPFTDTVAIVQECLKGMAAPGGGGSGKSPSLRLPKWCGRAEDGHFASHIIAFRHYLNASPQPDDVAKALFGLSIGGAARDLIADLSADSPIFLEMSLDRYIATIREIFTPASEIELARQRYAERKQLANESVQHFCSIKTSLFRIAYPTEPANHTILLQGFVQGLLNKEVLRAVMREGPYTDIGSALSRAQRAVATERFLVGQSYTTDKSGLSTTMVSPPTATAADGTQLIAAPTPAEAMDIDNLNLNEIDTILSDPEMTVDFVTEAINAINATGQFQGICWGCGSFGHQKASCPKKGGGTGAGARGGRGRGVAWGGRGWRGGPRRDQRGRFVAGAGRGRNSNNEISQYTVNNLEKKNAEPTNEEETSANLEGLAEDQVDEATFNSMLLSLQDLGNGLNMGSDPNEQSQ